MHKVFLKYQRNLIKKCIEMYIMYNKMFTLKFLHHKVSNIIIIIMSRHQHRYP